MMNTAYMIVLIIYCTSSDSFSISHCKGIQRHVSLNSKPLANGDVEDISSKVNFLKASHRIIPAIVSSLCIFSFSNILAAGTFKYTHENVHMWTYVSWVYFAPKISLVSEISFIYITSTVVLRIMYTGISQHLIV
jgi:hypothetical protein